MRIGRYDAIDLLPSTVGRMSFDKKNLDIRCKAWNAPNRAYDIAPLIACGNHDGYRFDLGIDVAKRSADGIVTKAEIVDQRKWSHKAVYHSPQAKEPKWYEQSLFAFD